MAKKNLPNIPIYIGDWERDCNVLSLESEAAWMRIIFKMFTNGKQSFYKIPTKGLQNLWRCSPEKVEDIISELVDHNICNINRDGRFTEFESRRFSKENNISEIRSEAVSKRKDRTNDLQNSNKPFTKHLQTTDIDYENENEIKNKKKGKKAETIIFPFDSEIFKTQWRLWKTFKSKEFKFSYRSEISEQAALKKLADLSGQNEKKAIAIINQSIENSWKGFFDLKTSTNTKPTFYANR